MNSRHQYSLLTKAALVILISLVSVKSFAEIKEKEVSLSGTVELTMYNKAGQEYRIMISEPEGEVPYTGGYPVIYILDANAYFASFHEAKRSQEEYQKAILVGVGYPTETPLDFYRRAYDFSPPVSVEENDPSQGGQDELLNFLQNKLMPEISKRYQVDQEQQILYGHSFAGMFTIYTMFTRSALFDHYIAVSPSLWWSNRYLMKHEKEFFKRVHVEDISMVHSSLAVIMAEKDIPQELQDAQSLVQRLQELSVFGFRTDYLLEAGEDHMSVPFRIESEVLHRTLTSRRR